MEPRTAAELIAQADERYAQNQIDEAAQLYEAAIAADPALAWSHSRLGGILAQKGQLAAAEAHLVKALELDPELPQAHSNLGNLYYTRGDYAQAEIQYRAAVAIDPTNPLYHENLHAAYKKMRKYNEAVRAIKHAHKLRDTAQKEKDRQTLHERKASLKAGKGCGPAVLSILLLVGLVTGLLLR
jgi:tetratricopeptide (TPR) repeat protein